MIAFTFVLVFVALSNQACLESSNTAASSFGSLGGTSSSASSTTNPVGGGLSPIIVPSASPTPIPTATPVPPTYAGSVVDVVVGYGGVRGSSIDQGKSWQFSNDVVNNDCWSYRNVAYGNGLWVAVTATGGFGRVSTTPDGVHWRHYESNTGAETIAYGGGLFVSDIFTSTDGYNFNFRPLNYSPTSADVGGHQAMIYSGGNFIISGDQNGIAVSTDGTNFKRALANYTSPDSNAVLSHMQKFAAGKNGAVVGIAGQRVAYSSDNGMTWVNQDDFFNYKGALPTNPSQYNGFNSVVFDGTQFIINGGTGDYGSVATTWKSTDGVTWKQATATGAAPFTVGGLSGAHFFGIGRTYDWSVPSAWFKSSDAVNWTNATSISITPTIADTSGYYLTNWVSGLPLSDPTKTPNFPSPSVLMPSAQLSAVCGSTLPPGR